MSATDLVIAITGASGVQYGRRLVDVLLQAGRTVHLIISPAAHQVFLEELSLSFDCDPFDVEQFLEKKIDDETQSR